MLSLTLTTNSLADAYAAAKADLEALQKVVDGLRKQIVETGVERIEGDYAVVEVALSERVNFDSKTAKTFLTPEQAAACTSVSLVTTLRIKPRI